MLHNIIIGLVKAMLHANVEISVEGGAAILALATSIILVCVRFAARNKISLITLGQASASTQIFIYFR